MESNHHGCFHPQGPQKNGLRAFNVMYDSLRSPEVL
jgi:hypothetical protein